MWGGGLVTRGRTSYHTRGNKIPALRGIPKQESRSAACNRDSPSPTCLVQVLDLKRTGSVALVVPQEEDHLAFLVRQFDDKPEELIVFTVGACKPDDFCSDERLKLLKVEIRRHGLLHHDVHGLEFQADFQDLADDRIGLVFLQDFASRTL